MKQHDRLQIHLKGPLSIIKRDGTTTRFPTQKAQALFAMIALAGADGISREKIATILWGRSGATQALANLRQSLATLRKSLGKDAEVIESWKHLLVLNRDHVTLDTDLLIDPRINETPNECLIRLEEASTLLSGISINEPLFEDWLRTERSRFRLLLSASLSELAETLIDTGQLSDALIAAKKLSSLDDFNEASHRLVMRIFHAQGETASALRSYEKMRVMLANELGISPSSETSNLLEEIKKNTGTSAQRTKQKTSPMGTTHIPNNKKELKTNTNDVHPVSEKPSIAVLPLANLSGDPEQEYFSDGITEDIITELSRFKTLYVIARHSSFAFKGKEIDIWSLGQKLNVQYVIMGSVRRAGERVRITAQLIDTHSGNHIWAERYDRNMEDIFVVQDEVTRSIVAVLPGLVQEDVAERASRSQTDNMKAYEYMLRGKSLRDGLNAEDTAAARQLFEKALKLDPRYARAYMYLADTYVVDTWLGLAPLGASDTSLELARKGALLDNNDVFIQDQLGFAFLCKGLWNDAEVQFDKTLSQIVNEAESMAWCGYGFLSLGHHEKAREVVLEAMRLDPLHPPSLNWILGQIYYFECKYEDAVRVLMGEALLNSLAHAFLAGALAHLGRMAEAKAALKNFIEKRHQEFQSRNINIESDNLNSLAGGYRVIWKKDDDWAHFTDGLRKAGLRD